MPAYVDTGLNLVDVRDVATGHILAAQHGTIGERYILGCQNMSLRDYSPDARRSVRTTSATLAYSLWRGPAGSLHQ